MTRPPSANSILRKSKIDKRSFEPKNPIAGEFFLPNVSNVEPYARKDGSERSPFTAGSIPFFNSAKQLAEDNSKLRWDNTNKRLYLGAAVTDSFIDAGAGGEDLRLYAKETLQLWANTGDINFFNADGNIVTIDLSEQEITTSYDYVTTGSFKFNATEYISQDATNDISFHKLNSDDEYAFYNGVAKFMTIKRESATFPNRVHLDFGITGNFNRFKVAGTEIFGFSGSEIWVRQNLKMIADNRKIYFGTGSDASIYYNGTNLIIDPDEVGIGKLLIGATGEDDLVANTIEAGVKGLMTSIGGFAIKLTNKTGVNSVQGKLVKADTATDDAVILTGINDDECFGVFLETGIADGSEAWVVFAGVADVLFDDNVTAVRGNWVGTGQAGLARTQAGPPALGIAAHFEEIGHSIENVAGGGVGTFILARCVLHFN